MLCHGGPADGLLLEGLSILELNRFMCLNGLVRRIRLYSTMPSPLVKLAVLLWIAEGGYMANIAGELLASQQLPTDSASDDVHKSWSARSRGQGTLECWTWLHTRDCFVRTAGGILALRKLRTLAPLARESRISYNAISCTSFKMATSPTLQPLDQPIDGLWHNICCPWTWKY